MANEKVVQSMDSNVLGHFGPYGGRFVPEALIAALDELSAAHISAQADPSFQAELSELHKTYSGRPSILTDAKRFSAYAGGAKILLKREDLNHMQPPLHYLAWNVLFIWERLILKDRR